MKILYPPYVTTIGYRCDIDGLRAIAVLSVVGFHLFPALLPGGFIGVDIFFVISGYLISGIIVHELKHQKFSFLDFYSRRIRRIFPALILVLAASWLCGWFTLLADEYAQLGKHIAGGAGFISNLLLYQESGYFDVAADLKPLLHLWSLGIEEQFYLLIPLVLYLTNKTKSNYFVAIGMLALGSFCLNIYYTHSNPIADFYSPLTRFWELLIGVLLALAKPESTSSTRLISKRAEQLKNLLSYLGATLLGTALLLITQRSSFPGYWALLPTLGSACIIFAGSDSQVNRMLSHRILVWIGLISYPLYLWHWVLLSFIRILEGEMPSTNMRIRILATSILLSWLTYKLVERPFRIRGNKKIKTIFLVLLMSVIAYIGLNTYQRDGLRFRPYVKKSTNYSLSMSRSENLLQCIDIDHAYNTKNDWFCALGDKKSAPTYFAYGDSHVGSLIPPLNQFGLDNQTQILLAGSSGCPPLLGIQSMRGEVGIEKNNCRKLNERIFEYVKNNKIPNVILAGFWTYYTGNITAPTRLNLIARNEYAAVINADTSKIDFEWAIGETVDRYKKIGVKVFLIADNPTQIFEPKDALRRASDSLGYLSDLKINQFSIALTDHLKTQLYVNTILKDQEAKLLEFNDIYCQGTACNLAKDGKFLYFDADHLSIDGSLLLYQKLKNELNKK
jgi:peptidoglycan/LPS O-acetylase OafA/YrhL